jgi:nucleoid DNA-binding protein
MTKAELVDHVAATVDLSKAQTEAVMCQHISGHSVPLAFKACS